MTDQPERCRVAEVCRVTGLGKRHVQKLAKCGRIPGAALLGGVWTFDRTMLRRWIQQQEAKACRTSIEEAKPGGADFKLTASNIEDLYGQLLGLAPRSG